MGLSDDICKDKLFKLGLTAEEVQEMTKDCKTDKKVFSCKTVDELEIKIDAAHKSGAPLDVLFALINKKEEIEKVLKERGGK